METVRTLYIDFFTQIMLLIYKFLFLLEYNKQLDSVNVAERVVAAFNHQLESVIHLHHPMVASIALVLVSNIDHVIFRTVRPKQWTSVSNNALK